MTLLTTIPAPTRRGALTGLAAALAVGLGLTGCDRPGASDPAAASVPPIDLAALPGSLDGRVTGITTGPLMAREAVYVFFDMQCPHCGRQWEASASLRSGPSAVKMVWVPVRLLNAASLSQGAALLAADDPVATMDRHKTSLLAGNGGIGGSAADTERFEAAILANTAVWRALDATSVPYTVARHRGSGQVVRQAGAMDEATLRLLLGL